jgi:hypothetical protein
MLKGSVEAWLKPVVVCEDEDFDEVSDWIASSADAAAPRAKNMTELQPMPRDAAMPFAHRDQQTPCHRKKLNKTWVLCNRNHRHGPAIDAAAAEFSALAGAHCPRACRMLRGKPFRMVRE